MVLFHTAASPPTNLNGTRENATSARLSWIPPSPLGDTIGYTVIFSASGGSNGSENVPGGYNDSLLLTGLESGETYNISLVARCQHIPSGAITAQVTTSESETYCIQYSSYLSGSKYSRTSLT